MHPYADKAANKVAHSAAKSRVKGYDSGGNVKALPMSPAKTADAIDRLGKAGILNKDAATDFAASRYKSWGLDPMKSLGRDAKYADGGRVKKPSVNINIVTPPSQGGSPSSTSPILPPAPRPSAPMLPPGGGPSMPPPMATKPPGMGLPPVPPSPGVPPMKRGGRVKLTGGAEGGMGRLQQTKNLKAARKS